MTPRHYDHLPAHWPKSVLGRLGVDLDIAIAEDLGVSRERVRQVRAGLGIPKPVVAARLRKHGHHVPERRLVWPLIVAMRRAGHTYSEIARAVGWANQASIGTVIRRHAPDLIVRRSA